MLYFFRLKKICSFLDFLFRIKNFINLSLYLYYLTIIKLFKSERTKVVSVSSSVFKMMLKMEFFLIDKI